MQIHVHELTITMYITDVVCNLCKVLVIEFKKKALQAVVYNEIIMSSTW